MTGYCVKKKKIISAFLKFVACDEKNEDFPDNIYEYSDYVDNNVKTTFNLLSDGIRFIYVISVSATTLENPLIIRSRFTY